MLYTRYSEQTPINFHKIAIEFRLSQFMRLINLSFVYLAIFVASECFTPDDTIFHGNNICAQGVMWLLTPIYTHTHNTWKPQIIEKVMWKMKGNLRQNNELAKLEWMEFLYVCMCVYVYSQDLLSITADDSSLILAKTTNSTIRGEPRI